MTTTKPRIEIEGYEPTLVTGRIRFSEGWRDRTQLKFRLEGPDAQRLEMFFNLVNVEVPAQYARGSALAPPASGSDSPDQERIFTKFEIWSDIKGARAAFEPSLRAVLAEHPIMHLLDDRKVRRRVVQQRWARPFWWWDTKWRMPRAVLSATIGGLGAAAGRALPYSVTTDYAAGSCSHTPPCGAPGQCSTF